MAGFIFTRQTKESSLDQVFHAVVEVLASILTERQVETSKTSDLTDLLFSNFHLFHFSLKQNFKGFGFALGCSKLLLHEFLDLFRFVNTFSGSTEILTRKENTGINLIVNNQTQIQIGLLYIWQQCYDTNSLHTMNTSRQHCLFSLGTYY